MKILSKSNICSLNFTHFMIITLEILSWSHFLILRVISPCNVKPSAHRNSFSSDILMIPDKNILEGLTPGGEVAGD